jgi:hypothetical protein
MVADRLIPTRDIPEWKCIVPMGTDGKWESESNEISSSIGL